MVFNWFIWIYNWVSFWWLARLWLYASSLNIGLQIFFSWPCIAMLSWFLNFYYLLNVVISFVTVSESLDDIRLVFTSDLDLSFQKMLDSIFLQESWIIGFTLKKRSVHYALNFFYRFIFFIHILIFRFHIIIYLIVLNWELIALNMFTKIWISVII